MKNLIIVDEAKKILKKYISSTPLLMHSRKTEVIMRELAHHFGEEEDFWGITGLLHDLDYNEEITKNPEQHGNKTCEIMTKEGYEIPEMFHAIKSHNENMIKPQVKRESKLDYCLAAAENISGLIYASALMRPDKKIQGMETSSLKKKFKNKGFASNVNREFISDIEKTGITLDEFFKLAIDAITNIADEIGI